MDMTGSEQWSSPSSSSSSHEQGGGATVWTTPPKRPAGRTKFKETRHPVYRGVRRRGNAGRWVCEVRVPGQRGERLWLGTYLTAESAARAHDAAMLGLHGSSASTYLNFADSESLLRVPQALSDLADVRRAALAAVAGFLRREAASGAATVPADEATFSASADNAGGSSATSQPYADGTFEVPAALGSDMFELEMSGEMDLGTYYADLAEGLLLDPPPPEHTGACWETGDGGADPALWSY
ncbi:dehydration-responsive element-binding protein 1H-like [Lolium rigidum]|uniref:dehydration-responsive element-binding protein 1H-like n=1 Tax=Lolium rigidum TaxID=89674 RepID=UPI001F5CD3E1|nr:dehydration-responsive element-binding protein 1H-like [Lolium rigidum]